MILATLGTHPQPMDRLVAELDRLLASAVIDDEVVIQAAAFRLRPRRAEAVGVVPFDDLLALVDQARVVITHGGPGSIAIALQGGHIPLVVPRDPTRREHVDDHQQRFVRWLAPRRPIVPVWDVQNLSALLSRARRTGTPGPPLGDTAAAVARRLDELVRNGTPPGQR